VWIKLLPISVSKLQKKFWHRPANGMVIYLDNLNQSLGGSIIYADAGNVQDTELLDAGQTFALNVLACP